MLGKTRGLLIRSLSSTVIRPPGTSESTDSRPEDLAPSGRTGSTAAARVDGILALHSGPLETRAWPASPSRGCSLGPICARNRSGAAGLGSSGLKADRRPPPPSFSFAALSSPAWA